MVEKLKPTSRAAPVLEGSLSECVYRGRKKAGTKSAKVATAPAKNTMREKSRDKGHSMKDVDLIGYRSLTIQGAGKSVARAMNPSMQNAQGTPNFWIIASGEKLRIAPPEATSGLDKALSKAELGAKILGTTEQT